MICKKIQEKKHSYIYTILHNICPNEFMIREKHTKKKEKELLFLLLIRIYIITDSIVR